MARGREVLGRLGRLGVKHCVGHAEHFDAMGQAMLVDMPGQIVACAF